jgi:hypothetical protein
MEIIMSAIDNTPENKNFLSPLNFRFQIKKAPHVNFFVQKVNIPDIAIRSPTSPNPFVNIPYPGDHMEFGALNITFKVDEDLQNYLELHNWIRALGKPEDFTGYADIASKPSWTGDGICSDISVLVLASTKMPNYEVAYADAFPISLTGITFNTTDPNVNYIEASATFKYTYFTITKI